MALRAELLQFFCKTSWEKEEIKRKAAALTEVPLSKTVRANHFQLTRWQTFLPPFSSEAVIHEACEL